MIYLSGPMSGKPDSNKAEFARVAKALREQGIGVVNPAELDELMEKDTTWEDYLARDIALILRDERLTGIAMLPGWETSRGATLEITAANRRKLHVYKVVFPSEDSVKLETMEFEEVIREKSSKTLGQKDTGLRLDLIPVLPLVELGLTYTLGSRKYADRNWEKGLPWSKCYAALLRHILRWWMGETRDQDGQHHLGSVAWHAFSLMEFEHTHPELDDRPKNAAMLEAATALLKSYAQSDRGEKS